MAIGKLQAEDKTIIKWMEFGDKIQEDIEMEGEQKYSSHHSFGRNVVSVWLSRPNGGSRSWVPNVTSRTQLCHVTIWGVWCLRSKVPEFGFQFQPRCGFSHVRCCYARLMENLSAVGSPTGHPMKSAFLFIILQFMVAVNKTVCIILFARAEGRALLNMCVGRRRLISIFFTSYSLVPNGQNTYMFVR